MENDPRLELVSESGTLSMSDVHALCISSMFNH